MRTICTQVTVMDTNVYGLRTVLRVGGEGQVEGRLRLEIADLKGMTECCCAVRSS
jgi:hypothetical protein